jgi:hypothetical protein
VKHLLSKVCSCGYQTRLLPLVFRWIQVAVLVAVSTAILFQLVAHCMLLVSRVHQRSDTSSFSLPRNVRLCAWQTFKFTSVGSSLNYSFVNPIPGLQTMGFAEKLRNKKFKVLWSSNLHACMKSSSLIYRSPGADPGFLNVALLLEAIRARPEEQRDGALGRWL